MPVASRPAFPWWASNSTTPATSNNPVIPPFARYNSPITTVNYHEAEGMANTRSIMEILLEIKTKMNSVPDLNAKLAGIDAQANRANASLARAEAQVTAWDACDATVWPR